MKIHDWADWSDVEQTPPCPVGASPLCEGVAPVFPPHEECDDSDDYAALIRKGIEVIPVDLFGTGKSADELRKEHMGAHYDDYNAMMARTRGVG